MDAAVVIRRLIPADLDAAWSLNQANVPAVGSETREAMDDLLRWSSIALVAEVDESLVGFCIVIPPHTDYDSPNYRYFCDRYDDFVYLDRVAVDDSWRGHGVGRAIYDEVVRRANAPWFCLEVNVHPPNPGSLAFHARLGFLEVDRLETRPGKIVSLMARPLRPDRG